MNARTIVDDRGNKWTVTGSPSLTGASVVERGGGRAYMIDFKRTDGKASCSNASDRSYEDLDDLSLFGLLNSALEGGDCEGET